ncbi:YisL family protein [Staphylococcus hyicus]|uniref:YisL family protein n=2 Tax=Staphylococcus hyicus TaxID=1284 RepID=A0ACD5FKH0_STAHY|nr:YisL family protein [Staphylococcus hyicus]MCE5153388.1 YisL family protein [Staphylococcus hyicus]MCO4330929.1 YisL family protein [Staphylococcus hyicus]MCO4334594.1 YisL family protein [Staphylococcus hyicus]MDP4448693.1 YisL family protein [Staphylococcus hyicus]MDP4460329.1 YisL family protein [Staphylococcus hyicus]
MVLINLHIISWIILLILFFATYENFSNKQGPTPLFKPLHMATRLFMLLVLITGVWLIANAFTSAGSNHMLLTLKMLMGIAIVGLMEVTIARKKRQASSRGLFIATWAVALLTIILGIILPWGPMTQLFH